MLAIEVGGSSVQATNFAGDGSYNIVHLEDHRHDDWLLASPGLVEGDRVRGAHHLNWMDVSASEQLGMTKAPLLGMNDAEASALGEWVLQGSPGGTTFYIVMGTGIGAMVVTDDIVVPVEFGHLPGFGPRVCGGCGNTCLDAQIGGHALPSPLRADDIERVVDLLCLAMVQQKIEADRLVFGGGISRNYPEIGERVGAEVGIRTVPSACPKGMKSAAPFGLLRAWQRLTKARTESR
jgi:hypothetical protein